METLAGFYTFGSNISLVSLAFDPVESITFPPVGLWNYFPAGTSLRDISRVAKWLNFYDPDDILGYPLKHLSASYGNAVSEDRAINVGGPAVSWNPLSHGAYWTDNDLTRPISQAITGVLSLL